MMKYTTTYRASPKSARPMRLPTLHALTFSGAAAIETCRGTETVGVPRAKVAEPPTIDVLVLLTYAGKE